MTTWIFPSRPPTAGKITVLILMRSLYRFKLPTLGLTALLTCLSTSSLAQEGAFSEYLQPQKDFTAAKVNFDNSWTYSFYSSAWGLATSSPVAGYNGNGQGFKSWPPDGDTNYDASSGILIGNLSAPGGRTVPAYDIRFWYKSSAGAPTRFRVDLMRYIGGDTYTDIGTAANGGIIDLSSTSWTKFRVRRTNTFGGGAAADRIKIVALQDDTHHYLHVGATYSTAAVLAIDNFIITVPRRLSGLYKVTGTTSKDLGAITFSPDGTGLGTYTNWIQNLGNVDILNVYGGTDISGGATAVKSSSNLLFTYMDSGSRQFVREQLNDTLTGLDNSTWMGSGVAGDLSTDRFYGYTASPNSPRSSYILRQVSNLLPPFYSHSVRIPNGTSTYASEANINLGGEQIVAVADINCDGADDFITRGLLTYNARLYQNNSGSWPNTTATVGTPFTLSSNGFLSCLTVADMNGDGFDDLLLKDLVSGDVFSLICTPSGGTLTWLFQLDPLKKEKVLALADADNDGLPDIYTTRQRLLDGVGEINIRKVNATGTAVTSFDLVAEFDYSRYVPCAVGDINGDGSADVVTIKTSDNLNDVVTYLVDPTSRHILGNGPHWICYATTSFVRPIFYHGSN